MWPTMDQTIETPETETPAETTDPALTSRIRTSLALAQTRITAVPARARAQWDELPAQLRDTLDKVLTGARDRLREALDLPSRDELATLLSRVEELDRRLANLQATEAEVIDSKPTKSSASKANNSGQSKPQRKSNGQSKAKSGSKSKLDKGARREAIRAAAGGGAKKKTRKS